MQRTSSRLNDLKSDESEFLDFYPKGYTKGKHRYIIVTGGVYSSVGKGIFSGSLGHLLQMYHYNVTLIKMEGYLNIDSGTINPFRHGEVFVLDDGTECDLDLGNYERYLNKNLSKDNFLTAGKIYSRVLEKERQGDYLGRDVLVIPHLTGEIKYSWRKKAIEGENDFTIIEIGGTAGDYENLIFIEAARQLKFEEGLGNVLFFHVTPIFWSKHSAEWKSKPTQHSVRTLMELGVQPDFIICRTNRPNEVIPLRLKEKVALYCNVEIEKVIESPDVSSTYLIPNILKKQNIVRLLETSLNFPYRSYADQLSDTFELYAEKLLDSLNQNKFVNVVVAGKYVNNVDSYLSIAHSLEHAGVANEINIKIQYIDTEEIETSNFDIHEKILAESDGIIVPGGFGRRGLEGKIKIVNFARENKIPYLGLCLGFQVALIEFARNVCKISDATSTEIDANANNPLIYLLPDQQNINAIGGSMRLGAHKVKLQPFPSSQVISLYANKDPMERFRHRYEFNKKYQEKIEAGGIHFVGTTLDGEINQIFELEGKYHPYFVGTQFHPEFLSRPNKPHPLFVGLVKNAKNKKY